MQDSTFADIDFLFYFQSKSRFHGRKDNPSEIVALDKVELDGVVIGGI